MNNMNSAIMTIFNDNIIRLSFNGEYRDFDVNDELSPLEFKQFTIDQGIENIQCPIISDEQVGVLEFFLQQTKKLFDGMDSNQACYYN